MFAAGTVHGVYLLKKLRGASCCSMPKHASTLLRLSAAYWNRIELGDDCNENAGSARSAGLRRIGTAQSHARRRRSWG